MEGNWAFSGRGSLVSVCILKTGGCSLWTHILGGDQEAVWTLLTACCGRVDHFLTPCHPTLGAFVCCLNSCCIFECDAVCCALMLSNLMRPCGSLCSCLQSQFSPWKAGAWHWVPALDMSIPVLWPVLLLSEKLLHTWSGPVTQSCSLFKKYTEIQRADYSLQSTQSRGFTEKHWCREASACSTVGRPAWDGNAVHFPVSALTVRGFPIKLTLHYVKKPPPTFN